jgi:hypothetical protein
MIKELFELHADRKLLLKVLILALKTDEVINQLHDEIHCLDKGFKELKIDVVWVGGYKPLYYHRL